MKDYLFFRPTLKQCFILFLTPIIFQFILSPIVLLGNSLPEDSRILKEIIQKPLLYILSFLPFIFYALIKGKKNRTRAQILEETLVPLPVNRPNFGKFHPILFFLLIGIAMLAISFLINPLMSLIPTPEWFKALVEEMVGGNIYISIFTVGICAPLLEELLFRGTIERSLLASGSPTRAILWSSALFALVHLNPWQAIPAFIFGIFMGWVYYRTHCLWATIFLHFVNNTTVTVLSDLYPELNEIDSYYELFPNKEIYLVVMAISIGILALTYFFISRYTVPVKTFK